MRSDAHHARLHLLEKLHHTGGIVRIQHDGSDFVSIDLFTGEKIILYIVETYMSLHEIQKMLAHYTANGWYTLFLFWVDMLLPGDGELFLPQDWMEALLALYSDRIYGFDIAADREVVVFPVHFEAQSPRRERLIKHGGEVDFEQLRCVEVITDSTFIKGKWRVAAFITETAGEIRMFHSRLQKFYDVLQISPDADDDMVKTAYRTLARQFHPDVNSTPEAHEKMQQINEAYTRIMEDREM